MSSKKPIATGIEKGRKYYLFQCGLTDMSPFCNGAHRKTKHLPLRYVAIETAMTNYCGSKRSKTYSLCQGTHQSVSNYTIGRVTAVE